MKRLFSRYFVALFVFVLAGTNACSSDDDNDNDNETSQSAGKALSGSYIGTMSSPEIFDVTLTITETANGKVRVSTDKGNTTPKEIAVSWNGKKSILGRDDQGIIVYDLETKTMTLLTNRTAEADVHISFEGRRK